MQNNFAYANQGWSATGYGVYLVLPVVRFINTLT